MRLPMMTKRLSKMNYRFKYLLDKLGNPKWWEETGHPRYCVFAPDETYNIYASEVALIEIACQQCSTRFLVSMNWSRGQVSLSKRIRNKSLHYGDPPNIACCPAGATMNCLDLRVVEFWQKNAEFEWVRLPEFEVDLEDANEVARP